jgi:hypothetical protein
MGFKYESAKPDSCTESPADIVLSNFIDSKPECALSTNANGDIVLTVTNLRGGTFNPPQQYGVFFTGLTNGNSAESSTSSSSQGGTYSTLYEGDLIIEKIEANEFSFSFIIM